MSEDLFEKKKHNNNKQTKQKQNKNKKTSTFQYMMQYKPLNCCMLGAPKMSQLSHSLCTYCKLYHTQHTGHSTIERDLSRQLCVEGIQKFLSNVAV